MDTFEQLASGISDTERRTMLRQLEEKQSDSDESEAKSVQSETDSRPFDLAERMRTESFFVKLWIFFKSLFSGEPKTTVYNGRLIDNIAASVTQKFPGIYGARDRTLQEKFFIKLEKLRDAAAFFRMPAEYAQQNKSRFYVFIGDAVLTQEKAMLEEKSDPFKVYPSFSHEKPSAELRSEALNELEAALNSISEEDRREMNEYIKAFEWLSDFISLPLERFTARFISVNGKKPVCSLDAVASDFEQFCETMINYQNIPSRLLNLLSEFSSGAETARDKKDAIEKAKNDAAQFSSLGLMHIASVKDFNNSVPCASLVKIALFSPSWTPRAFTGAGDWFSAFKSEWKKIFEKKWTQWLKDEKYDALKQKTLSFLALQELPVFEFRPWENLWGGLPFRKNVTMGFLKGFQTRRYPAIAKPLKILMLEGDFYQRDNRQEFTDSYNEMIHCMQSTEELEKKLSPKGEIGQAFLVLQNESIRTIENKSRADSLIITVESELDMTAKKLSSAFKSLAAIIDGILSGSRKGKYDALVNGASIEGRRNAEFKRELAQTASVMQQTREIIQEIAEAEK